MVFIVPIWKMDPWEVINHSKLTKSAKITNDCIFDLKDALAWKFTNWDITFSIFQDVPKLVIFLFYLVTVENFEKLKFEVIIFYMYSYGTAGKN